MVTPQPLNDPRRIIEALHVPVAVVAARAEGDTGSADLRYYAVSRGFSRLYGPMFKSLMGFAPNSPEEWRGLQHAAVFPMLQDPGHEWSQQLLGALTGEDTGWRDTAWKADEKLVTVAYQLTAISPGWAAVEAVDIESHARRILEESTHG